MTMNLNTIALVKEPESDLSIKGTTVSVDYGMIYQLPDGTEVLRIDKSGITYLGERMNDAGEAHRALIAAFTDIKIRK